MDESTRQTRVARFKALTERELPERAREQQWPLRFDHCFKRVCLDWAFNDCWYRHIKRPAERHMDAATLERAIRCAEEILAGGREVLQARNTASLMWRGKARLPSSQASARPERQGEEAR